MAVEAIVTRMDFALRQCDMSPTSREALTQWETIERILDCVETQGYRIALISEMSSCRLQSVFDERRGAVSLSRFSVVVCGEPRLHGGAGLALYDMALHALDLPPERTVALASCDAEIAEARQSGIPTCVALQEGFCALMHQL